jgi:DNA polymerase beta domain protein region
VEDLRIDASRLAELCRRYGISRLEVFGSVARGEQRPDSDVDLLYTLEGGRALGWEVEDLVESLTEVFHRPVDLVSRRSLHPMIRDRVMAEAETLYAAA